MWFFLDVDLGDWDDVRVSLAAFIHLCRLLDAQPVGSTLTWLARPHAWSTVSESLLCSTA